MQWVALWLTSILIIAPANAASFDCGKASTKVEHVICHNATLSSLDSKMAQLYRQVLAASDANSALVRAQRNWLRYRDTCLSPVFEGDVADCLVFTYRRHIDILRGSLPSASNAGRSTRQLCAYIAGLVEAGRTDKLEPNYEINGKGEKEYHLDIDGDGMPDRISIGCGSAECYAQIRTSSIKQYDLGELGKHGLGFYFVQYGSHLYAIVTRSEGEESGMADAPDPDGIGHRAHLAGLYLLGPKGAERVCGK